MAKIKKISINAFEGVMKESYIPTSIFDWHGIEVTVKKNLSLKEMLEFVDTVVKTCFTSDTNTYLPELKDFATKMCVLEKYANFTMPTNVESRYELIYSTDAVESVLNYVNPQQFNEICVAIAKKIDNLAQANVEAVNRQMNELYNAFDNLQTQISGLFNGVKNEDIQAVTGAIANGFLNEEKLIQAYTKSKSGDQ